MARHSLHSPLNAAVREAGQKLSGLLMTNIVGEPDKADALNLIDDLMTVAKIVDGLVEEIGQYAKSNFGNGIDLSDFTDQLQGALAGNATYVIESAADDMIEARDQDAAEYRAEGRREMWAAE